MICSNCRRDVVLADGQRFCQYCGHDLLNEAETIPEIRFEPEPEAASEEPSTAEQPSAEPDRYCPWEDQENLGFLEGMLQTLKGSLFYPKAFFARLPREGGFLNPLLFALIVETFGSLVGYLWTLSVDHSWMGIANVSGYVAVLLGLAVPLLVFLSIVIWAVLLHVSLFLVRGAHLDFEATFRVVCYCSGPELCALVPVIGGPVALVWKLCLAVIGLREVQETSTGKAVVAVLLPVIVCCGFAIAGVMLVAVTVGLAGNN